jgi:hypothetical protein
LGETESVKGGQKHSPGWRMGFYLYLPFLHCAHILLGVLAYVVIRNPADKWNIHFCVVWHINLCSIYPF